MVKTWEAVSKTAPDVKERDVREVLQQMHPVWNELFPAEQARVLKLLVRSVTVYKTGVEMRLHASGLNSLVRELR